MVISPLSYFEQSRHALTIQKRDVRAFSAELESKLPQGKKCRETDMVKWCERAPGMAQHGLHSK